MSRPLEPARVEPVKGLLLVKRYVKPEKVFSLFLPSQSREDKTGTLWEFVKAAEDVFEELGMEIPLGSIIKARVGHAVDSGLYDPDDRRDMFFMKAEDVGQIIPNTWSEG